MMDPVASLSARTAGSPAPGRRAAEGVLSSGTGYSAH